MRRIDQSNPRLPFSWIGGDPTLDFHNTVQWSSAGLAEERLHSYADLAAWATEARLLRRAQIVLAVAAGRPRSASRAFAEAYRLRRDLHDVLSAMAKGRRPREGALSGLNVAISRALRRRRLELEGGQFEWGWQETDSGLRFPVLEVAWSAARLLTSADIGNLRACANEECGWLFIDRSRRHNRRWCEMSECGSRDKAMRYYRKVRAGLRAS